MVVRGVCCWLGTVIRGWVVVVRDEALPFVGGGWSFVGGGWSFVVGDGHLWWRVVVHGGRSSFVDGSGHLWWGVVVHGWGWSFIVI